jgi:hypothetical protein
MLVLGGDENANMTIRDFTSLDEISHPILCRHGGIMDVYLLTSVSEPSYPDNTI